MHNEYINIVGFPCHNFGIASLILAYFSFAAALVNWSLISFVDLIAFLIIQYNLPRTSECYATYVILEYDICHLVCIRNNLLLSVYLKLHIKFRLYAMC